MRNSAGYNRFLGRFGQPEDIARVAVFLASEDAGWVTGRENDGGRRLSLKPRDPVCPLSLAVQSAINHRLVGVFKFAQRTPRLSSRDSTVVRGPAFRMLQAGTQVRS
jgi:hypothetical protein